MTDDIKNAVESFVADVEAIVRREALKTVQAALTGATARTLAAAPQKSAGRPSAPAKRKVKARPNGAKRSPEELEALKTSLREYVANSPGKRLEEIAPALGRATSDLKGPIAKLVGAKDLRTKGQRRGTRYYARG